MTSFVPRTFTSNTRSRVLRPYGRHPGAVEHALGSAQRSPHGATVAHVALDPLQVEVRDRRVGRAALDREHHLVAALGQQPRDVRADEAGRTGDENRGQVAGG